MAVDGDSKCAGVNSLQQAGTGHENNPHLANGCGRGFHGVHFQLPAGHMLTHIATLPVLDAGRHKAQFSTWHPTRKTRMT
jgi:hypothetical protein